MLYLKALHIIFIVTWFSGMFYLVRLFIYNREAQEKTDAEREILSKQFNIMIPRLLFGITLPSAIFTLICGLGLLSNFHIIPPWLLLKFSFLLPLFLYYISLHHIWSTQKKGDFKYSSKALRIWNEVATLFLVVIVFTAITKDIKSFIYGLVGLVVVFLLVLTGMRIFRKTATKKS